MTMEEWFKDNGWKIGNYNYRNEFCYATKMFGKDKVMFNSCNELTIFRDYEENNLGYANVFIDDVTTTEELEKILDLFGYL